MKISKNPNEEIYEEVTQAVKDNDGYCPCVADTTPESKCPCKSFLESQELGECHCGRYVKTEVQKWQNVYIAKSLTNLV